MHETLTIGGKFAVRTGHAGVSLKELATGGLVRFDGQTRPCRSLLLDEARGRDRYGEQEQEQVQHRQQRLLCCSHPLTWRATLQTTLL